ncbi:hypothetical protein [uncultured Tateyamaria sp.]|uniref:hypothetical protein n=1 Tax=Tateyamaria sp. 1078 TaxID=3417464 RepID=UPI002628F37C|nr:hypothetical protein [uncultured Tateyamaria sp.]
MMQAERINVRKHLAHVTDDVHQALHHDPLLSRLMNPGLTASDYADALAVFHGLYAAVERARTQMDVYPEFSVHRECHSLEQDLRHRDGPSLGSPRFRLGCEHAVLGALYVAHGAAFGRNSMRSNILHALPQRRHHFVGLSPSADLWTSLLKELDMRGQVSADLVRIEQGADRTFAYVSRLSRNIGRA